MAWNFQVRALGAAMAFVLAGAADAALTEQQIKHALGSAPGVAWSLSGPNPNAWTVSGEPALNVASAARGEVHSLTATVTGPGVLKLLTRGSSPDVVVEVNGVPRPSGYDQRPIYLGEGTQTVTWKVTHVAGNDNPATVMFRAATWEPFNLLPLSAGEADGSVKLSGPWVGQDAFHHGDGAAAYYGGPAIPPRVLKGEFTGPGVLIYEISHGLGRTNFALDGAEMMRTGYTVGKWGREWHPVDAGAHVATWTAVGEMAEAAVDEVRVVPEVDLGTAMDTPGRVWTSTASGLWRAFGVLMADAPGGNSVLLDSRVTLSSVFTSHGLLKILSRQGATKITINGREASPVMTGSHSGWGFKMIALPAGGGTVTIDGDESLEIGGVEWFPELTTLEGAMEFPEGSLSLSAARDWELIANGPGQGYGARSELSSGGYQAWMDLKVTGPARAAIGYTADENGTLSFLLDGEEVWNSRLPAGNTVTLEIPAGEHVIRCRALSSLGTDARFVSKINRITVTPDVEGRVGRISEALGFPAKWAFVGEWEKVESPSFDGEFSLRPVVPEGMTGEMTVWLGTNVKSVGGMTFRMKRQAGGPRVETYRNGMDPYPTEDGEERGWGYGGRDGDTVQISVTGTAEELAQFRLDEMISRSWSEDLPRVSAGPLQWHVYSTPWGVANAPEGKPVAKSSVSWGAGDNSSVYATVEGTGILSFRWKKQGQSPVDGELWVDQVKKKWTAEDAGMVPEYHELMISGTDPVLLEWRAAAHGPDAWLEMWDIVWRPWYETDLVASLDAPVGVTWEAGGDVAFTGRPDSGAANGTGAYVRLEAGQSAWLEATVDGPGVFADFDLRELSHAMNSWDKVEWVLTVDGTEVRRSGQQDWNPVWIRGAGPHQVRVTFTNPTGGTISGLVDQVKWIPLVTRTMDASWTAQLSETLNGYNGPDGGGWILRTSYQEPSWIEKTVTGPCEVTWNSQAAGGVALTAGQPTLTVNGKAAVRILREGGWDKNTLIIPAGTHVVRWSNVPLHGNLTGPLLPDDLQSSYWQISDPVVTPGVSPFAEAVDAPDTCWLVQGAGGEVITGSKTLDGVDAYAAPAYQRCYYLNLTDSTHQVRGGVLFESTDPWYPNYWGTRQQTVPAGESSPWAWDGLLPLAIGIDLDKVVVEEVVVVAPTLTNFDEAVESPAGLTWTGWRGVLSATDSADGVDCGWSVIDVPGQSHVASITVNTAGTFRFRWNHYGESSLLIRLNGAIIPLVNEYSSWEEVSITVGSGTNRIEWEHKAWTDLHPGYTAQAWLDGITFETSPPWDLTAGAVAMGPGVQLTADMPADPTLQWKAFRTLMKDEWQETNAARVTSGASVMRTTVTGPKVMSLQAWCFADDVEDRGEIRTRSDTETSWPIGSELTVSMDGIRVGGAIQRNRVEWDYVGFMVPEGTHEITFQLNTLYNTGEIRPASRTDLQAWVSNIWFQSQKSLFDNSVPWDIEDLRGAHDDADGDGVINLLEYAWKTRMDDVYSKPPQVIGRRNADGNSYEVRVPYLNPFVTGTLQSSTDMVTWEDHPVQWLESKPAGGAHTATHQLVTIPVSPDDKAKFFRMKVEARD